MCRPTCEEMLTELEDAKDIFRMATPRPISSATFESGGLLTPAFARNVPRLSFLCGSGGLTAFSFGGVSRNAGVVASDDSSEVGYGWYPGIFARCCEASSAASLREIAEAFLWAVLKVNFDFGAKEAFVASSFSFSALMAYRQTH